MKKTITSLKFSLNLLVVLGVIAAFMATSGLASAESTLDKIKARGTLIAGVKDSTPPSGFVDKDGKIKGFDIDIIQYIANKLGVKAELKPVTSATRIPMLSQGSIDIIAATMTHTKQREEQIDFSLTYMMTGQKILVKKSSGMKVPKDLAGKKVGTTKGSTSEKNFAAYVPEAKVISFDDYAPAFLALQQGKVEAVTTDETILIGLKNSSDKPEDYEVAGEYISKEPYGLGIPKGDGQWREFVDKALLDMYKSGEWRKAYDRWFGPTTKFSMPTDFEVKPGRYFE